VTVAELWPEISSATAITGKANAWKVPQMGGSLWALPNPPISVPYFAVVGEIRYTDVSNGYLELGTNFAPEEPDMPGPSLFIRTRDNEGPFAVLKGTSDWRTFCLPFDSSRQKSRLTGLVVNLKVADPGVGHIEMRNVKLVQYPDGLFPESLVLSGTLPFQEYVTGSIPLPEIPVTLRTPPAPQDAAHAKTKDSAAIDWRSFLLGVAATGVSLLAGGGIIFISRRWNRRQHERELRRIASLDS
jgi:hypothetical protein